MTLGEAKEKIDKELIQIADSGFGGQGAIVEMMRRLKDAIIHLDASNSEQQAKMLKLTKWIMILTFVMAEVAIIQVYSLFR
jgi:hypothetical protein